MILTFQSQPGSPSQHEDFDFVDVENDMEDFKSRIKKEAGVLEEGNIFCQLHNRQHNYETFPVYLLFLGMCFDFLN